MDLKNELEVAKKVAREAGEIILKYFDGDQKVESKSDGSPVTIADKLINSMVIGRLQKAFPDDGIIGEEESTSEYGMGRKWFCDPIDGTRGFVWGLPTAMFSLALVIDGRPVLGVAYDPFLDKLYTAIKEGKSYCNSQEMNVSGLDLKEGVVAITSSVKSWPKRDYILKILKDNIKVASFGGAVYRFCLVARGKFVGYIEHGLNAHDVAASQVIIECAGGKVTDIEGNKLDYSKPFKGAIASNGMVHDALVEYCK